MHDERWNVNQAEKMTKKEYRCVWVSVWVCVYVRRARAGCSWKWILSAACIHNDVCVQCSLCLSFPLHTIWAFVSCCCLSLNFCCINVLLKLPSWMQVFWFFLIVQLTLWIVFAWMNNILSLAVADERSMQVMYMKQEFDARHTQTHTYTYQTPDNQCRITTTIT